MTEEIPVVKILIKNQDGKLLMLRKSSENGFMSEKWEQPGGKIQEDENRFKAAKREIKEETNLEIGRPEDLVRLEIEDDEKLVKCFVMYTSNFSGDIELSEEHSDYRWTDKDEALELDWHKDASYILPVIEYLEEYRESKKNYGTGDKIKVVKLLIQNDEGRFLAMQKTAEDKIHSGHKYTLYGRMAGKWELPGGRFKESNNRFDASKREVKEETGLDLGKLEDVVREEIEEENDVDTFIIHCKDWKGEIQLSKEHQDYKWVTAEEYKKMNWHQDAGYGYPPMKYLEEYLQQN
ncbi:MAG: NUDIX domain-containing protein [Candidatus Nanohaloarchaea archaeon]